MTKSEHGSHYQCSAPEAERQILPATSEEVKSEIITAYPTAKRKYATTILSGLSSSELIKYERRKLKDQHKSYEKKNTRKAILKYISERESNKSEEKKVTEKVEKPKRDYSKDFEKYTFKTHTNNISDGLITTKTISVDFLPEIVQSIMCFVLIVCPDKVSSQSHYELSKQVRIRLQQLFLNDYRDLSHSSKLEHIKYMPDLIRTNRTLEEFVGVRNFENDYEEQDYWQRKDNKDFLKFFVFHSICYYFVSPVSNMLLPLLLNLVVLVPNVRSVILNYTGFNMIWLSKMKIHKLLFWYIYVNCINFIFTLLFANFSNIWCFCTLIVMTGCQLRLVGIELNPGPTISAPIIQCPIRTGASMTLLDVLKIPKHREVSKACLFNSLYNPIVYPNDRQSQESALVARVLKQTPVVDRAEMGRFTRWVHVNLHHFFKVKRVYSKSFNDYLKDSNAKPSVKKKLASTHEYLDNLGYTENTFLPSRLCKKWTIREGFVKVENNIYASPLGNKQKAARLIQGAKSQFICLVGPFIAALQDEIKLQWNSSSPFYYTCGADLSQVANYLNDFPGEIVEDDVSAWDSSYSRELCLLEIEICRRFGAPEAVLRLMRANIATRGYTKYYKYSVDGTRKSGDPYTSLFNSVMNGLVHAYIYCKEAKVHPKKLFRKLRMVIQGDDNTLIGERMHRINFKKEMLKLGFAADAIKRNSLEETEFCSCFFMNNGDNITFVPKLGRLLMKLGFSVNLPHNIKDSDYMIGIAVSLNYMFPHDKLIQALINCIHRLYSSNKPYIPATYEHKMRGRVFGSLQNLYLQKYNLSSSDIRSVVTFLKTAKIGDNWPLHFQLLTFDYDTGGEKVLYIS